MIYINDTMTSPFNKALEESLIEYINKIKSDKTLFTTFANKDEYDKEYEKYKIYTTYSHNMLVHYKPIFDFLIGVNQSFADFEKKTYNVDQMKVKSPTLNKYDNKNGEKKTEVLIENEKKIKKRGRKPLPKPIVEASPSDSIIKPTTSKLKPKPAKKIKKVPKDKDEKSEENKGKDEKLENVGTNISENTKTESTENPKTEIVKPKIAKKTKIVKPKSPKSDIDKSKKSKPKTTKSEIVKPKKTKPKSKTVKPATDKSETPKSKIVISGEEK